MQTLIRKEEVIAQAFADTGYFDPEGLSAAEIAAAEDRYVVPVTGRSLYERMLAGGYDELREGYAAPAAAYAVRLLVQPMRDIHTGAGGTTGPYSGNYRPAGTQQLAEARRALRTKVRALLLRLSDHLAAHAEEYPEYDPSADAMRRISTEGGLVLRRS